MKNGNWQEASFELSNGVKFTVIHNIPGTGNINSIHAAFDNWMARTNEYTQGSFIAYINSKGVYEAMTKEQFTKIKWK